MRLFVYGTLLDPSVWAAVARTKARGGEAVLIGWRRVTLRNTPYPTLRRGGQVRGAERDVDPATLRRLSAYEGPRYRLTRVVLTTPSGKTGAWTWIAAGATHRPWRERRR